MFFCYLFDSSLQTSKLILYSDRSVIPAGQPATHFACNLSSVRSHGFSFLTPATSRDWPLLNHHHSKNSDLCTAAIVNSALSNPTFQTLNLTRIPNSSQILTQKHNARYVHLRCMEKNMDFPTLCRLLDIKPEERTELDQVQRFITFCNEARRAPCFYQGLGRLYD